MVKTTQIFTPTQAPSVTTVKRATLWNTLDMYAEQGGAFISILGTTKLGKSTLAKSVMKAAPFHTYIPGQNLAGGATDLWNRLAADLELPSSGTKGKVTGDKTKWGVFARLGLSAQLVSGTAGGSFDKERSVDESNNTHFDMDIPSAVAAAFATLAEQSREDGTYPPIIVIDDFHFILSPENRRELVLALRPITESGVTVILATLPGREADEGFNGTNVGGRHYVVKVPRWADSELSEIAHLGFDKLNVQATDDLISRMVSASHGSPQIMQQLCLNMCRMENAILDDNSGVEKLEEPNHWPDFFATIKDFQSVAWLQTLSLGLTARKPRKAKAKLRDGRVLDGYQLILWALHELGAPAEIAFSRVSSKIGEIESVKTRGLQSFALAQKAKNMNTLASRDMKDALLNPPNGGDFDLDDSAADVDLFTEDELRMAEHVPQPVFEVVGDNAANMRIRILDPQLAYTLNWHPSAITGDF